jgi:hypothetical protein
VEKPGRTQDEAPRRWHGQRVIRQVEVEDSDGWVALEPRRFIVLEALPKPEEDNGWTVLAPPVSAA